MALKIFLVKPHPPTAILNGISPVPEPDRYHWEPMALKLMSYVLTRKFPGLLDIDLWHLMDTSDDNRFIDAVMTDKPDIIAFSEIDILVNEVSRLAVKAKDSFPEVITVVGGKQTSVLHEGDRFPFKGIDHAYRGDGVNALVRFIDHIFSGQNLEEIAGYVHLNSSGVVKGPSTFSPQYDVRDIDGIEMRSFTINGKPLEEYFGYHNVLMGLNGKRARTAPILTGTGCSYSCTFCQSPIEYGEDGRRRSFRSPPNIAEEIRWLIEEHGVEMFFSLEPNLDLQNLLNVYDELSRLGIHHAYVSGFIRPDDIVRAHSRGVLPALVNKGMRILSVGLDINIGNFHDPYNKAYSWDHVLQCLHLCRTSGIIVLATWVGRLDIDADEFNSQLDHLLDLPLAWVDVRLPIAIRNTPYYRSVESGLIYHPDIDTTYYDQQNYRYQTLLFENCISPDETYSLLNSFYEKLIYEKPVSRYVKEMKSSFPDTVPFWGKYYSNFPGMIKCIEGRVGKL